MPPKPAILSPTPPFQFTNFWLYYAISYRVSQQNVHDWNQIFNTAPFKWFQIRVGGRGPCGQIFAPILWVKSEQTQVLLKKIRVKAHKFATNSESRKRYISGTDMECYKNVYTFNWSLLSEMRVKMEGRKATKKPKCKKISHSVCQISQKFWADAEILSSLVARAGGGGSGYSSWGRVFASHFFTRSS